MAYFFGATLYIFRYDMITTEDKPCRLHVACFRISVNFEVIGLFSITCKLQSDSPVWCTLLATMVNSRLTYWGCFASAALLSR